MESDPLKPYQYWDLLSDPRLETRISNPSHSKFFLWAYSKPLLNYEELLLSSFSLSIQGGELIKSYFPFAFYYYRPLPLFLWNIRRFIKRRKWLFREQKFFFQLCAKYFMHCIYYSSNIIHEIKIYNLHTCIQTHYTDSYLIFQNLRRNLFSTVRDKHEHRYFICFNSQHISTLENANFGELNIANYSFVKKLITQT